MVTPELLSVVKETVLEAGSVLREMFEQWNAIADRKVDGSPVTAADLKVNELLKARLTRALPEAGWLSEEGPDDLTRLDKQFVWIIDPLDGTKEFIKGVPEFAISVGLAHQGRPILGAVYNPAAGQGGVGVVGGQCEFWGFAAAPEHSATHLRDSLVNISASESRKDQIWHVLRDFTQIRPIGSVAYKLLRIAAGCEDFFLTIEPKSEWDLCGGVAMVLAAQRSFEFLDRRPVRFNQVDARIRCGSLAGRANTLEQFRMALVP